MNKGFNTEKLIVTLVFIFVVSFIIILFSKGIFESIIFGVMYFLILLISRPALFPKGYGNTQIRKLSLYITLSVYLSTSIWHKYVEFLIILPIYNIMSEYIGPLPEYPVGQSTSYYFSVIFVAIIIIVINYLLTDRTIMRKHSNRINGFPDQIKTKDKLLLARSLESDLRSIDNDTEWDHLYFSPLDAEVELRTKYSKKKKLLDLMTSLKKYNNSKTILLLGEPGSGKSVTLRKLCVRLLSEVNKTGKIPIYINLKEWETDFKLNEDGLPKVDEVHDSLDLFIYNNLMNRLGKTGRDIIEKNYTDWLKNGDFFFLFDSFDEIPLVFDASDSSEVITIISKSLNIFLNGAHDSRGIIASRLLRKPTIQYEAKTTLVIRPFSEVQIEQALKNKIGHTHFNKELLFERLDLLTICRNPFVFSLITEFIAEKNSLPNSKFELYENYVYKNIRKQEKLLRESGLTIENVIDIATNITELMYSEKKFGLEVPIKLLEDKFPNFDINSTIEILRRAGLGRNGYWEKKSFSFVHRRFNEYFMVLKLRKQSINNGLLEQIPKGEKYNDVLILYCELANDKDAKRIAQFCWNEISKVKNDDIASSDYLRYAHCIRFLISAFSTRLESIESFREGLFNLINSQIEQESNMISSNLAVEAVGLLRDNQIDSILLKAIKKGNEWYNETVIKSCRYLSNFSWELERSLLKYYDSINIVTFIKKYKDLSFSLKLSNGFKRVELFCKIRKWDTILSVVSLLILTFFAYKALLIILPVVYLISFLLYNIVNFSEIAGKKGSIPSAFGIFRVISGFLIFVFLISINEVNIFNINITNYTYLLLLVLTILLFPIYKLFLYIQDLFYNKKNLIIIAISIIISVSSYHVIISVGDFLEENVPDYVYFILF